MFTSMLLSTVVHATLPPFEFNPGIQASLPSPNFATFSMSRAPWIVGAGPVLSDAFGLRPDAGSTPLIMGLSVPRLTAQVKLGERASFGITAYQSEVGSLLPGLAGKLTVNVLTLGPVRGRISITHARGSDAQRGAEHANVVLALGPEQSLAIDIEQARRVQADEETESTRVQIRWRYASSLVALRASKMGTTRDVSLILQERVPSWSKVPGWLYLDVSHRADVIARDLRVAAGIRGSV